MSPPPPVIINFILSLINVTISLLSLRFVIVTIVDLSFIIVSNIIIITIYLIVTTIIIIITLCRLCLLITIIIVVTTTILIHGSWLYDHLKKIFKSQQLCYGSFYILLGAWWRVTVWMRRFLNPWPPFLLLLKCKPENKQTKKTKYTLPF